MSACGQCGNSGCGGCGALVVPEGPVGLTGATGANGTNGTNGVDGAPGFLSFSFSNGIDSPFIAGGNTAGKFIAYLPWPGTANYPAILAMQRMFISAYYVGGGGNYDIEIFDETNGSALVASAYGKTNSAITDVYALTINAGNFSTGRAIWGIFITDNTLSTDKVRLTTLTMEW